MTNHPRSPRDWFLVARVAMLLCFVAFYLFWFVPTTRKGKAYEQRMNSVFNAGWYCSQRAFAAKQYEKVGPCFADWDSWTQRNHYPDAGIDWPWATWKEAGR